MKKLLSICLLTCFSFSLTAQTKGSYCDSLVNAAYDLYLQKNFNAAIPLLEKALRACSKDTAMSDYDYYSMLAVTSISYYEAGHGDSALITGESAAKYFKKINAYDNPLFNTMLGRMGIAYVNIGEYKNAVDAFETCIPFFKKRLGAAHPVTLEYMLELATTYSSLSNYQKSMDINRGLYKLIIDSLGKNNAQYISVLTNMGNDFTYLGQYDSALIFHTESLQLRGELMGKKHNEYARGLLNVGMVYKNISRLSDALLLLEQARTIYLNNRSERAADYSIIMFSLGQLYLEIGKLSKAEQYLKEALDISRSQLGYYHPQTAMLFGSIAGLFSAQGKYEDAVKMNLRSKEILEYTTGDSTASYATAIGNLGLAYSDLARYDSALYFLKRSLSLKDLLFGKASPASFTALNNLGSVAHDMGNYRQALGYYYESKKTVSENYGRDNYIVAGINGNIALSMIKLGEIKNADSLIEESFNIRKKFILGFTESLSDNEKYVYSSDLRSDIYTSLNLRRTTALDNRWLYNGVLFFKGMLLEGSTGLTSAFKQFTDPSLKKKAEEYLLLKATITGEALKPADKRLSNLRALYNRAENLERELLAASAEYRKWKQSLSADWKTVQSKLKENEAAIEFITYYSSEKGDANVYYAALVLKKESAAPELVQLFTEDAIARLIRSGDQESIVKKLYRSTIKSPNTIPTAADSLYNVIWQPLLPAIKNVNRVYFSVDGVLSKLNLAAIITPSGKRLLEDYEFIQLSSTRSLANKTPVIQFDNIQLWGGINYDSAGSAGNDKIFNYLPGTLSEVKEISNLASETSKKVAVRLSSDATEKTFKQLNGNSPDVLHIATHGFFFPDPAIVKSARNKFSSSFESLLRSGLALANANDNWNSDIVSAGKEDGVLTAFEIANLDLSNTKLVVLSACETGLGDIHSGEGVYGLQRAFKLAGVDQIIMSLWQVPDLETKEFMQLFYSKCFSGMDTRKAFRETQLQMNKKYQPYQWAAFVLVE